MGEVPLYVCRDLYQLVGSRSSAHPDYWLLNTSKKFRRYCLTHAISRTTDPVFLDIDLSSPNTARNRIGEIDPTPGVASTDKQRACLTVFITGVSHV